MAEHTTKDPFVSCIKVKGINLLPPLITQKRSAELQGYKQQAVKLERRLQHCRDLKKSLENLLNLQPLTERPYSEISFRDDSHVEALGIVANISENNLPTRTKSLRQIKLSKDIIDVTQYNSEGIKVIYNDENYPISDQGYYLSCDSTTENIDSNESLIESSQIKSLSQPTSNHGSTEKTDLNSDKASRDNEEHDKSLNESLDLVKIISPKPRLIRSNSYTLETPSPILLAHLEKTERSNKLEAIKNLADVKHLSTSKNWSSLENNYIPFENSEFSSISTVYDTNLENFQKKNENMQPSAPDKKGESNAEKCTSPAIEVIQTDISVQKITVNAGNEVIDDAVNENCDTSNSQLVDILKNVPDEYAKQIIDMIESQKLKKQRLTKNVEPKKNYSDKHKDNTVRDINEDLHKLNLKNEHRNNLHQSASFPEYDILQGSVTSISPSQSLYYSITSSDTLRPLSNPSIRLVDLEYDDTVISFENSDPPKKADITEYYFHEEVRNVNRELFPQLNMSAVNEIKQEWAASIIGAHVKGYLTRRLLKTDRVQSLIETIKDALMCALQLHNAENIDESDVELHRRLINQVSAACYTFHDIFFALSVQEQMLIISADRQRMMEKAKRPASAPNTHRPRSSSVRSTPRQRVPSHSRSVTKV